MKGGCNSCGKSLDEFMSMQGGCDECNGTCGDSDSDMEGDGISINDTLQGGIQISPLFIKIKTVLQYSYFYYVGYLKNGNISYVFVQEEYLPFVEENFGNTLINIGYISIKPSDLPIVEESYRSATNELTEEAYSTLLEEVRDSQVDNLIYQYNYKGDNSKIEFLLKNLLNNIHKYDYDTYLQKIAHIDTLFANLAVDVNEKVYSEILNDEWDQNYYGKIPAKKEESIYARIPHVEENIYSKISDRNNNIYGSLPEKVKYDIYDVDSEPELEEDDEDEIINLDPDLEPVKPKKKANKKKVIKKKVVIEEPEDALEDLIDNVVTSIQKKKPIKKSKSIKRRAIQACQEVFDDEEDDE